MNEEQLQRYSRHLLLPDIDCDGQKKLFRSKALIIGLGGLGSPSALYLAASGIGTLVLNDHDAVDLSNLQRQIIHTTDSLGRNKAHSAASAVQALNPDVQVIAIAQRLRCEHLDKEISSADVVVDATDNFLSKQAINEACRRLQKPLVSGAAIRMAGQITSFRFDRVSSPCYHCLYPYRDEAEEGCAQGGILSPVTGVIGSLQAIEALKILLDFGETLQGRLLQFDARTMAWRTSALKQDPSCPVCSTPQRDPALEYLASCR